VAQGNKVKLTCQFRGREMEFQNIAREMFDVRLLTAELQGFWLILNRLRCSHWQHVPGFVVTP